MQHLDSAAPPAAHPQSARWIRSTIAVLLTLAAPAVSTSGALTTGLKGTSPAVAFPHGYWSPSSPRYWPRSSPAATP